MRRRTIGLFLAALALAAASGGAALAQGDGLTGSWRGFASLNGMSVQLDLVVQPSGAYSETVRSGQMMTLQSGEIRQTGAGVVTFVVEDWEPKTQNVFIPGAAGGHYETEATGKPPGGTYRLQFNGPGSVTMQDVNFGGAITFSRVQ